MAQEAAFQNRPIMSSVTRPVQKGSPRYSTKPRAGLPEFDMFPPLGKTNGFVIQITEAPPPPPGPPSIIMETQGTRGHTSKPKPQPPPLAIPPKAHISNDQRPTTPPSPPISLSARSQAAAPTEPQLPRSSPIVRSNSGATPVMRSMFPRYDPNIPMTQQRYLPDIENVPGLASAMAVAGSSSYRPPSYLQQPNDRPSSAYVKAEKEKVKATNVKESPFRSADAAEEKTTLSSPEQLLDLWDIANGQAASEVVVDAFVLELSCDDLTVGREIITFNASTSDPIYTLEASHSRITTSRIHPGNRNPTIQITTSTLEKPTSTDPLVTCTFPKLAGLMALDHSSNVAVAHKLDRKASADLQAEAISRAQEHEASMLLWDSDSNRYCLMHPTLLDSAATTLPIEIVPTPSNPQTITISAPETHTPLLTLSLQSLALTVHAPAIKALPSLYILDTLMATLLALLLHLHRSCASTNTTPNPSPPASTSPLFPPPPTRASNNNSPRSSLGSKTTTNNKTNKKRSPSRFSIFRSNRSLKSTRSLYSASACAQEGQEREEDIELQYLPPPLHPHHHHHQETLGKKHRHHQPPTQLFSTDDEGLPRATRAVLRLLYWVFEVLFWCLGVAAQVLAAGVVGAGKLVTKL